MAAQKAPGDFSSRYKFNGKELDEETGLYYYGARYYDPKVSLWLSVDPLAEKYPGMSPYTYTADNPVVLVDPDGRDWYKPLGSKDPTDLVWYDGNEEREGYQHLGYNYYLDEYHIQFLGDEKASYYISISGDRKLIERFDNGTKVYESEDSNVPDIVNGVSGLAKGLEKQKASFRVTNGEYNGNKLSPKIYKSGWNGGSRAKIKTYKVAKAGKVLGKGATGVSIIIGVDTILSSYEKEGYFGTKTQQTAGGVVGGFAGSWAGTEVGAAIGVWFGGLGAIPGAIIGGIIGGIVGDAAGKEVVKEIQNLK